jgi:acetyl esterase/lipase
MLEAIGPATRPAFAGGPITVQTGIPYETVDGRTLALDLYLPSGTGTHPGILLVHGGQFHAGDRTDLAPVGRILAKRGYVAFAIDYRLAPHFHYPAAVQDAIRAVTFMRANAATYHLDPTRIGALGTSAGGTIVAWVGTTCGRGTTGSQLAGAAALSGPMDLASLVQQVPDVRSLIYGYVFGHRVTGPAGDAGLRDASPAGHIGPGSAPLLMAFNTAEPFPVAQYQEMAGLLGSDHVPFEFFRPPPGPFVEAVLPRTLGFLARYVAAYHGTPGTAPPACRLTGGAPVPTETPSPSPSVTPPATATPPPPRPSPPPVHRTGGSTLPLILGIAAAVVLALGLWVRAYLRRPTF